MIFPLIFTAKIVLPQTHTEAGLFLHDFLLHDFTLTQPENLHHFQTYYIMFGLMQFGAEDM
jgi:hypothetical protein